jgi:hypothetical protein
VERILSHYFGDVSPEQTIAICHWALQDLAPANTMFTLIERLAEGPNGLPTSQEIYDVGRQEALERGFQDNCRDVIGMLRQIEQGAGEPNLANLFRWFRVHAEALLRLHFDSDRRFPLDTFLCERSAGLGPDERSVALTTFFAEVEVPLIIWPEGEHYSINSTPGAVEAVFLNRCVVDLFQRMWNGTSAEWQCPIYKGCDLPFKDDVDCRTQPWKKNTIRPTCPYGAAANILGLGNGKVPTFTAFDLTERGSLGEPAAE